MTIKNSARNIQLQNAATQINTITNQLADIVSDPDPMGVQVITTAANAVQSNLSALLAALKNPPAPTTPAN